MKFLKLKNVGVLGGIALFPTHILNFLLILPHKDKSLHTPPYTVSKTFSYVTSKVNSVLDPRGGNTPTGLSY